MVSHQELYAASTAAKRFAILSKSCAVFFGISSKIERTFDGGDVKTFQSTNPSLLSCKARPDSSRSVITAFAMRSISSIGCIAESFFKVSRVKFALTPDAAIEKSSSLSWLSPFPR